MGNRRTWVISEEFPEFNHDNRAKKISELGSAATNNARYEGAFRWWTEILGQSSDSFQSLTVASAVLNHACWIGHGGAFTPGVSCTSRNNVVGLPGGYFSVNVGITTPMGQFLGSGTAIGTGGTPLFNPNASTEFEYDHARWMDPRPVRGVLITGNYGHSSYYESFYYTGFRVSGNSPLNYDPSYTQHGIILNGMGEGSILDVAEVNTCNGHGVWVVGAGPGHINYLSSFDNQMAGLCFGQERTGTQKGLGRLTVNFLSCDNNVWAILNNGGGKMTVTHIKSEDGLSAARNRPKKGQVVYEAHGWSVTTLIEVDDAVTGASPAPFVINTLANASSLNVLSYTQTADNANQNSGRSALLMLPRGKKVWRTADPNGMKLESIAFKWKGSGASSGTFTCDVPMVEQPCPAQTRLGLASTYAGYDYAAGTPVLDLTFGGTPPPPPPPTGCTWVLGTPGTWGACVNGQESRTTPYVSSVAGCTPTDPKPADLVETRACTPPPPPSGALHTTAPFNNTATNGSIDLNPNILGVRRVRMTNVRFTPSSFQWQRIMVEPGSTKGLRVAPTTSDGKRGQFRSHLGKVCPVNVPLIEVGVTYPVLEITLPDPMDVDRLLAAAGTGGAMQLVCDRIELFAS